MIQILMKRDCEAGIKDKEALYKVLFDGEDIGLSVRALKASHAENKLMEVFRTNLNGKEIDYDLEAYWKSKNKKHEGEKSTKEEADLKEAERGGKESAVEQLLPGME